MHWSQTLIRKFTVPVLLPLLLAFTPGLQAEPLRIGIYQNPPKIFLDQQQQPSGFFPAILEEIAANKGWQLNYHPCQWDACLEMLAAGEIDLLPDVAWSAERAKRFDFNSEVVLYNWSTLYRRGGIELESLADLDGRLVAVLRGSIQYQQLVKQLAAEGVAPHFIEVGSPAQLLELAAEGEVDAVLLNRLYGQQERRTLGLRPTHLIVEQSHLHFAATAERHSEILTAIDQQLVQFKGDRRSSYYRAMTEWIENASSPGHSPAWLSWLLQGLIVLAIVLLTATWLQRKQLRHRKSELIHSRRAIQQGEQLYRTLFQHTADAILLYDGDRFEDCNQAALSMFGYPDPQAFAAIERDALFPSHQADGTPSIKAADQRLAQAMASGFERFEWLHRRAGGEVFPTETTLIPMKLDGHTIVQVSIRDLSQQQAHETQLEHLSRSLYTLSQVNHAMIHAQSEEQLLVRICRLITEDCGYQIAWIGYAQRDQQYSILPQAQAGLPMGYLDTLSLNWRGGEHSTHPSALAIRHGSEVVVNDIQHQPRYAALHHEARHFGYRSCIALPLQRDQQAFGVLTIYSQHPHDFGPDEIVLLRQLVDDLAFAIKALRQQGEYPDLAQTHEDYQHQLQQAMLQTIQSFAVMLEMRDPYTAGHQRRSAELAVAIARELGMDEQRIDGVHFASMLHDIGNIQVPAEILIRPGRLSDAETKLMRNHAEAGYTILQDIHFPWPVAEFIYCHHERQDGSGYPRGLRDEQIPLEARIIGVADVVEAMLSHRPYRSALGLETTMKELREGRGTRYDPEVVDACIRLFEEKDYNLGV